MPGTVLGAGNAKMNKTWQLPFSKWKKTHKPIKGARCGQCSKGEDRQRWEPPGSSGVNRGAGTTAGFTDKGQRRENVFEVEGNRRTKAKRAEGIMHVKGSSNKGGQGRAGGGQTAAVHSLNEVGFVKHHGNGSITTTDPTLSQHLLGYYPCDIFKTLSI